MFPLKGELSSEGREPVSSCCAGTLLKGMGSEKASPCVYHVPVVRELHILWRVENKDQTPGTS